MILSGHVRACHDVSDGGLLVAVAEMAMAGHIGVRLVAASAAMPAHDFWFGEEQGRYVLAVADEAGLLREAEAAGVAARAVGRAGGDSLTLPDGVAISISSLSEAHRRFFPSWMEGAGV